jgi:outer membrane receptor protein involved in Fe transport
MNWLEASISMDNIFDTRDYEWVYMERGRFVMAELKIML